MTEPTTAYIVLIGTLAMILGLLARAFYIRRAPTIRSVLQAERKEILRTCKQTAHGSSMLTPDVLGRIEIANASDETSRLNETGVSQLRAAARDCIRAELIKVLSEPSCQSSDGCTTLPTNLLDRPQPNIGSPLVQDGKSIEHEASRQLLRGAINRHMRTSNATQTLAAVLDIVDNHSLDYSQLIGIEDEAELALESEWT